MRCWTLLLVAMGWGNAAPVAPLVPRLRGRRTQEALVGHAWILLDYTVAPWARRAQQHFAADLVGNASSEADSDWHLFFGVVIFHENASYELALSDDYAYLQAELRDPYFAENFTRNLTNHTAIWPPWWWDDWNTTWEEWEDNHSNHSDTWENFSAWLPENFSDSWIPRNTHLALEICDDLLYDYHYSYPAVVLLTNGSSSDWWHTVSVAEDLKAEDALIFSIGLDNFSARSWNRTAELAGLASSDDTQFDAILRPPHEIGLGGGSRRLTAAPLAELAELLGTELVHQLSLQAHDLTSTQAGSSSSSSSWTSTSSPSVGGSNGGDAGGGSGGGGGDGGGLAGGIVVLIVLLTCCCISSLIGVAFYLYKQDQKRRSTAVAPSPVVPTATEPPQPSAAPPPRPPAPPRNATEKGLQEAIDMQDLEKLRSCLSELLLQGWPDERYSALILRALDTVASLKSSASSQLEATLARGDPVPSLANARLSGVEPQLLRRAEELREEVMS